MLTEEQKALVDVCVYLRGRIITSYSQVEFLLADISVILDLKFPYLIGSRITAAKAIAERPGFEAYRDSSADFPANYSDSVGLHPVSETR